MTSPVPTSDPGFPGEFLEIAERICERYYAEYPDTDERYGARGRNYCAHDNAYLVGWMLQAAALATPAILERNVRWLADLLAAREFPMERYARNLQFVADAIVEAGLGTAGDIQSVVGPTLAALVELGA